MVPCLTRLEPKTNAKLRQLAKKNKRSISAELAVAVEKHLKKASK